MATEILSERYCTSKFAHNAETTAKTFHIINGTVFMAMNDADADADNVFVRKADEIRVPKATGQAWTVGDEIYYHGTNENFTTTASGATLAGVVAEPAESADDEGIIDLNPFFKAAA